MARATLTPVALTGTKAITFAAAGATSVTNPGVQFQNNGLMFLYVSIGASGAGNITMNFGRTVEGAIPAPVVVAVSNSTNYLLGPWSPTDFTAQDGTGFTYIDFSVITGNAVTLYECIPVS